MPVRVSPVLIGRDDLIALAEHRLDEVLAGRGLILLLAGEAGIGKTRLLGHVRKRAAARGLAVIDAAAYPRDAEVAGAVLLYLATALVRDPATEPTGRALADRLRGEQAEIDSHRRRRLLVGDLAESLGTLLADGRPRFIGFEDLHWADDLTLEVLDRVAGTIGNTHAMIASTYRVDEPRAAVRGFRARLVSRRLAEEVRLARLSRDETAALCRAITADTPAGELVDLIHNRSDGVPLHVEELLGGESTDGVPESLAEAILARAGALTPAARDIAAAASAIGRSFDLDMLAAVTGVDADGIDAAVGELTARFFVQPSVGETYDFRHALIRDALYADLAPMRRRELHAQVARAAIAAGAGDAYVSLHFERARLPLLAYPCALAAAHHAVAMSAHREAVELYRRTQRTTPSDTPAATRADTLASLGAEFAATDDPAAAATAYSEAIDLRRQLGDDAGVAALMPSLVAARHLLGASLAERISLLTSIGTGSLGIEAALSAAYMLDRRLDEAIAHGRAAREMALSADDPIARVNVEASLGSAMIFAGFDEGWAMLSVAIRDAIERNAEAEAARGYRMIGSSASVLVEYPLAEQMLAEGIAYAERVERFNDRHYMTAHLGHVRWATGDWATAEPMARQALADGAASITTRITAGYVLGYLALGRGDWNEATARPTEAYEWATPMAELQRISPPMWGLAEVALRTGRTAEAIDWCERGYAASAKVDDAAYLFPYLVTGVRAYLAVGDLTGARDWAACVSDVLRRRGIPGTRPAIDHAAGLLHLAEGQTGKARTALQAASAAWDAAGRVWEGAQAYLDRSRCAARSRRPAEAAELSAEAARRAAGTVLAPRVGAPHAGSKKANDQPLSAREMEVARLLATGATNREVAAALHISPKTVAAHVEHILTKLGAVRRAEVAAWVARHLAMPNTESTAR